MSKDWYKNKKLIEILNKKTYWIKCAVAVTQPECKWEGPGLYATTKQVYTWLYSATKQIYTWLYSATKQVYT